jgi:hypothetical protein
MCAILSLQIHLGIPVVVEENNRVSGCQVDTQTTGASGKKE